LELAGIRRRPQKLPTRTLRKGAENMRAFFAVGIAVAAYLAPLNTWACSCRFPIPTFEQVARNAAVVVVAEITGHLKARPDWTETGFEVRVLEVIKGAETRKVIRLMDTHFSMCSQVPRQLPIGSRYAIVLRPGDPNEGSFSICKPRIMRILAPGGTIHEGVTTEELRRLLEKQPVGG
jgi:hypothetical protein